MNNADSDDKSAEFWNGAPRALRQAANKCRDLLVDHPKVGLFAFGPMAALIGLGSLLGNKNGAIPILKERSTESWSWPLAHGAGRYFDVEIPADFASSEEAVIQINFTAAPPALDSKRLEIERLSNARSIIVSAHEFGNNCLGHPDDGLLIQNELTMLLRKLDSEFGVRIVHLLVCASNCACVHIGRAVEQYCPRIRVYDFAMEEGRTIVVPRIDIVPSNTTSQIELPP